jgi:hypothetical protein
VEPTIEDGRAAAQALIAEYEKVHGPLPSASRQRARQFLLDTGLLAANSSR